MPKPKKNEAVLRCKEPGCAHLAPFNWSSQMTYHRRAHHDLSDRPFKCSYDGCKRQIEGFIDCKSLREHIRTHTKEKPYTCKVCGAVFVARRGLNYHIKAMHTMDRPFECDEPECDWTGMVETYLTQHKKSCKHKKKKLSGHGAPQPAVGGEEEADADGPIARRGKRRRAKSSSAAGQEASKRQCKSRLGGGGKAGGPKKGAAKKKARPAALGAAASGPITPPRPSGSVPEASTPPGEGGSRGRGGGGGGGGERAKRGLGPFFMKVAAPDGAPVCEGALPEEVEVPTPEVSEGPSPGGRSEGAFDAEGSDGCGGLEVGLPGGAPHGPTQGGHCFVFTGEKVQVLDHSFDFGILECSDEKGLASRGEEPIAAGLGGVFEGWGGAVGGGAGPASPSAEEVVASMEAGGEGSDGDIFLPDMFSTPAGDKEIFDYDLEDAVNDEAAEYHPTTPPRRGAKINRSRFQGLVSPRSIPGEGGEGLRIQKDLPFDSRNLEIVPLAKLDGSFDAGW